MPTLRSGRLAAVSLLVLALASAANAKRPCPPGRFLVPIEQSPIVPGAGSSGRDVITLANQRLTIASGCGPAPATRMGKPRATKVQSTFRACTGLAGKVRFQGSIDAATCNTLTATLRGKKAGFQASVTAERSRCGDGIVDDTLGETCDPPAAGTCDDACNSTVPPGSVTGAAVIPDSAVADVDTNDPSAIGDNDTIFAAQPIGVATTIGGAAFVVSNNQFDDDYYRIDLDGSPLVISLAIADPDHSDLDLHLLNANGQDLIQPSTGISNYEEIAVSGISGTAYIGIITFLPPGGASATPWTNYVLSIGQGGAARGIPTTAELMDDEMIVRLASDTPLPARARVALPSTDATLIAGDPTEDGGALFRLPAEPSARRATGSAGRTKLVSARDRTLAAIAEARRRPDVAWAEPNYIRHATAVPNDSFYSLQWHYPQISLPAAWDVTTGSSNVIVAVIDTGILGDHPDIDPNRLVGGYDFISDAGRARDGNGIDPDPSDPGDLVRGNSSTFHGTHVAGTIGAATNNGIGVAGVDWHGRIMNIRVLGQGGGTDFDIVQGIRFAAGLSNNSGTVPPQRADIINMSLGGGGSSVAEANAVQAARAAGVIVVVAAGNDNQDAAGFTPANIPACVTVSAVDILRQKAPYSNFGTAVDLAAPGGDTGVDRDGNGYVDGVLSTLGDDSGAGITPIYKFYQGTSMATPHMAGVVALMQAAHMATHSGAKFTPSQLDTWITSGAITDDVGNNNWSGAGLINAQKAVAVAGGAASGGPASLHVVPASVNFGAGLSSAVLTLSNAGGGSVSIQGATKPNDATWLSGSFSATPPFAAPGSLTLTVDRTGLPAGAYNATVTIQSSAGNVDVPITITVGGGSGSGDVGPIYILLVDPSTRAVRYQTSTSALAGYQIDFQQAIDAGTYALVAGTDRDNDGFIGDSGEAFGIYPSTADPAPLTVAPGQAVQVTLAVSDDVSVNAGAAALQTIAPPRTAWPRR